MPRDVQHNPKKIFLTTTKVNSKLYKTVTGYYSTLSLTDTSTYVGAEFCVVSNLEYRQTAAIAGS